jgi:hypothetical protein
MASVVVVWGDKLQQQPGDPTGNSQPNQEAVRARRRAGLGLLMGRLVCHQPGQYVSET